MSLYAKRVRRERELIGRLPSLRKKFCKHILSDNMKTYLSINLPVKNCKPSKHCSRVCYACTGHTMLDKSLLRALLVADVFDGNNPKGFERLVAECSRRPDVRLCASGDFTLKQLAKLRELTLRCPKTIFWGFSRRQEIVNAVSSWKLANISLILSVDSSTPKLDEIFRQFKGPMAWGPRVKGDVVPDHSGIVVVFPEHVRGVTSKGIPCCRKDCMASFKASSEHKDICHRCKRCIQPLAKLQKGFSRRSVSYRSGKQIVLKVRKGA